jgi:hypothetical protein
MTLQAPPRLDNLHLTILRLLYVHQTNTYLGCSLSFSIFTGIFCIGGQLSRRTFTIKQKPPKCHKSFPTKQLTKSRDYTFKTVVVEDISHVTNRSVSFPFITLQQTSRQSNTLNFIDLILPNQLLTNITLLSNYNF